MPYAIGAVSAAEQAALALDKYLVGSDNGLRSYNAAPVWSTALDWTDTGAQIPVSTAPAYWLHDGNGHLQSRPQDTTTATVHVLFDLADITADYLAILGHNFEDLPGTVTARLRIADSNTFASNLIQLKSWTDAPFSDRRLVTFDFSNDDSGDLGEYVRITSLRWAALTIQTTSTFSAANGMPRIGEVFFGQRRQLARRANYPGDPFATSSKVSDFDGDNGAHQRVVHHHSRLDTTLAWTPDTQDALGIDDQATWSQIYDDTNGGTGSFLFARQPSTDPQDTPLVYVPDPRLLFEAQGPTHAAFEQSVLELRPFIRLESAT